jgi:hypothetical protein
VVDASRFRVVVVSPRNHFLFTPMLASAAVPRRPAPRPRAGPPRRPRAPRARARA